MASEDRRKHLEMIQGVIARLAGNSFSIKGWAVTVIAVLGGLAAKDADPRLAFGLWLPVVCFWGLDAYYLRQERVFRKLYNAAVEEDPKVPPYAMNPKDFVSGVGSTARIAFSPTVLWLHVPIVVFVLAVTVYSFRRVPAPQTEKATTSAAQGAVPDKPAVSVTTPAPADSGAPKKDSPKK